MADRNSAYIFSEIFKLIATEIKDKKTQSRLAKKFWKMSRDFDFSDYQMDVDSTLIKLRLARKGIDPEYPQDGVVMLYGPEQ